MLVALLERDPAQTQAIQGWLQEAGEECQIFQSVEELKEALTARRYDVLAVNRQLPQTSGEQIVQWVREHLDWPLPVLLMDEPDCVHDWSQIVQLGADDYLCKPLDPQKTVARVTALGSGAELPQSGKIEFPPFEVNYDERSIRVGGREPELTRKEFELAAFLFEHYGETIPRGEILRRVWHRRPDLNTRTVDTHVSRIRHKLRLDGQSGWQLRSIYQRGYRLTRQEIVGAASETEPESA